METPSSSQALTKRDADTTLMPPPSAPPVKRIKRPSTVLDEDTYTEALSQIIARDFFPGLVETQTKQEFLDALESKDKAWIASAGKKVEELMTPGRASSGRGSTARRGTGFNTASSTPRPANLGNNLGGGETPTTAWGGDTPASVMSTGSTATTRTADETKPDVSNLSLGAFQAKYTSEDNESFNKLLDKQNLKRRQKYAWMWNDNKILSARQIAYRQREAKRIAAESRNTNVDKQLVLKTDLDARPAKPDTWKSTAENNLMFSPSGIEDTHETIQQRAEQASRASPKQVVHSNTRIQPTSSQPEHSSVPPSPSLSAIQAAIAGRPRQTESEAGYTGGETPRVNGYAFVDEDEPEPGPEPGAANSDESDALTAYHLKLLSSDASGDSTPNPFSIKENRKREDLHHRIVEKVARSKRVEKHMKETKTPVPRFPSSPMLNFGRTPRGGIPASGGAAANASSGAKMLTPAAQKLLQKVGSTPRASSSTASTSHGGRNMWTPTPRKAK